MSQNDRDYEEKRDFIRMMINAPVTVRLGGREITGKCIDLSHTGMQLEVSESIATGTEITVHLAATGASVRDLESVTKVIRSTAQDNGKFLLGLETEKMN